MGGPSTLLHFERPRRTADRGPVRPLAIVAWLASRRRPSLVAMTGPRCFGSPSSFPETVAALVWANMLESGALGTLKRVFRVDKGVPVGWPPDAVGHRHQPPGERSPSRRSSSGRPWWGSRKGIPKGDPERDPGGRTRQRCVSQPGTTARQMTTRRDNPPHGVHPRHGLRSLRALRARAGSVVARAISAEPVATSCAGPGRRGDPPRTVVSRDAIAERRMEYGERSRRRPSAVLQQT